MDRTAAIEWLSAIQLLFIQTGRQLAQMRAAYPDAVFVDLARFLEPPEKYFWDGHVYDEANMLLAERIYKDIRPMVERSLREVR
jgi:hypothetical protein